MTQLKAGQAIDKPIYDFPSATADKTEPIQPRKVIIVEGLFALDDQLKDLGDVKTFVDIGTHGRIIRRLLRDVERTGQAPADILRYFSEVVEPMHDKYVDTTKRNADFIINNEYNPKIEAEKSGLHEVQIKFHINMPLAQLDKKIRSLGADRIASNKQVDHYYNPSDRDLMKTGEILRIRQESGKRILTYKGPKVESSMRVRPKLEFEIDRDTTRAFLNIYSNKQKTITKIRTTYQSKNGLIFSIDHVEKQEGGQVTILGDFMEIRSIDPNVDQAKIAELVRSLGLNNSAPIQQSYFEM